MTRNRRSCPQRSGARHQFARLSAAGDVRAASPPRDGAEAGGADRRSLRGGGRCVPRGSSDRARSRARSADDQPEEHAGLGLLQHVAGLAGDRERLLGQPPGAGAIAGRKRALAEEQARDDPRVGFAQRVAEFARLLETTARLIQIAVEQIAAPEHVQRHRGDLGQPQALRQTPRLGRLLARLVDVAGERRDPGQDAQTLADPARILQAAQPRQRTARGLAAESELAPREVDVGREQVVDLRLPRAILAPDEERARLLQALSSLVETSQLAGRDPERPEQPSLRPRAGRILRSRIPRRQSASAGPYSPRRLMSCPRLLRTSTRRAFPVAV